MGPPRNPYKPYPCGVVIHSIIDACLALKHRRRFSSENIVFISMRVNNMVLALTDRRHQKSQLTAQVSCYHWAAVCLMTGKADLSSVPQILIDDGEIYRLRELMILEADDAIAPEAVEVVLTMDNGEELRQVIAKATDSVENPMTAEQIREKFLCQAEMVMSLERAHEVYRDCWRYRTAGHAGQ